MLLMALASVIYPAPALPAYPPTAKTIVEDRYGTATVSDPYRWLEGNIRTTPEVRAWVAAENGVTDKYLKAIPARARIAARLTALSRIEQESVPIVAGELQFYLRQQPDDEQYAIWVRNADGGNSRKLVDPAGWSKDGSVALAAYRPNQQGTLVAYAMQAAGSDWRTWRVVDARTGQTLPDAIAWNKFSTIAWDHEGRRFYYARFPAPEDDQKFLAQNRNQEIRYHRLGTPQSDDALIYADPAHPDSMFNVRVSEDGRFLVVNSGYDGDGPDLLALDLHQPARGFVSLAPKPSASHATTAAPEPNGSSHNKFVNSNGNRLFFISDVDAPNRRLLAVDIDSPDKRPIVIIPEGPSLLSAATTAGSRIFAQYLQDSHSVVREFDETGALIADIPLPGAGLARGFAGSRDAKSVYFDYSDFTTPQTIYEMDIASGAVRLSFRPKAPLDEARYATEQVFFTARDGKRIAMFVVHRRDLRMNGDAPALLYGYGGFGLTFPPSFRAEQVAWVDMGGIFAFPALPGDGTYGESWHRAGMLTQKTAVFDAFVDAAQYLIDRHYTRPERLAALGYSNGGLLVGAAVTRRPDLFAVAFPTVGVLDMLRYPQFTNGRLWSVEYGSPSDAAIFPYLLGYSPYHNIRQGVTYPAMLIGTADTDDRVAPAHSLKFAARVQAEARPGRPVLLEVQTHAGHGAGTSKSQGVSEAADRLAFAVANLKVALPDDFDTVR
jgi:prolyl oligopeptidase